MANEDEIIEKRASSPVATASLIISALALLGAIFLQLLEIGETRNGLTRAQRSSNNPAERIYTADLRGFKERATGIIETNTQGDEGFPHHDEESDEEEYEDEDVDLGEDDMDEGEAEEPEEEEESEEALESFDEEDEGVEEEEEELDEEEIEDEEE